MLHCPHVIYLMFKPITSHKVKTGLPVEDEEVPFAGI